MLAVDLVAVLGAFVHLYSFDCGCSDCAAVRGALDAHEVAADDFGIASEIGVDDDIYTAIADAAREVYDCDPSQDDPTSGLASDAESWCPPGWCVVTVAS